MSDHGESDGEVVDQKCVKKFRDLILIRLDAF